MKFVAILNTLRPIERPIQYHGPTKENVSILATKWLESNGYIGDSFVVSEVVRVDVAVIECSNPLPVRAFKHHVPDIKPGTSRCDKCNQLYAEHI